MARLLVLLATLLGGCGYNTIVTLKERVDSSWAQVENQLQRRNDLIPNLVEVTKGYATHEREVFDRVADARARLIAGGTREQRIEAANQLSGALGRLLGDLATRFDQARRFLNHLTDQYLFPVRNRWFPAGGG